MSCKGVRGCLLLLAALLSTGRAEQRDRFHYDYWTLRMGGLTFAGIMLTIGIIVLLMDFNLFQKMKEKCKVTSEA
ncbi:FXYD domain-containing ion transport regulator 6-like [Engystomops pustulosus]|uniref:FXYD domain-containing ion transport regulator 6-like n=1 Tax=Engystomops pustulosus TaxID=76066 RepID=UPI003AFA8C1E